MAGAPNIDVQTVAQLPFREAADAMASRVPVLTPSVLDSAREFWLSQRAVAAAPIRKTLTKMAQTYLERYLSAGGESNQGFTDWLAEQHPGITRGYAETVRRAALGNSYSDGRVKQMREHNERVEALVGTPDIVGFRLLSAGDAAVRPEHAALDGIAFPLNERGLRFMPPNGFGCRCDTAPVFADENAQLASDAEMAALERFVDDGWLNAPSSIMEDRASLASRAGRVKLAEGDGTRWITIGGGGVDDETGEPTGGGRRVQIDGQGRIVKGLSKNAEGKTLDEAFSDTEETFGRKGDGVQPSEPAPRTPSETHERLVELSKTIARRDPYSTYSEGKFRGREAQAKADQAADLAEAELDTILEEEGLGGLKVPPFIKNGDVRRRALIQRAIAVASVRAKEDPPAGQVNVAKVGETKKAVRFIDAEGNEGWYPKSRFGAYNKSGTISVRDHKKAIEWKPSPPRKYYVQVAGWTPDDQDFETSTFATPAITEAQARRIGTVQSDGTITVSSPREIEEIKQKYDDLFDSPEN